MLPACLQGLVLMDIEATRRLRTRLRTPEAQGKAERLMDIVGTISQGRGATLGARQLWARMSGTMVRLRRSLHDLLQQASTPWGQRGVRGSQAGRAPIVGQPTAVVAAHEQLAPLPRALKIPRLPMYLLLPQAECDELNYILCTINAPAMVEVCSRATMELLTQHRLKDLTTETRRVLACCCCCCFTYLDSGCWFHVAGREDADVERWKHIRSSPQDSCQTACAPACRLASRGRLSSDLMRHPPFLIPAGLCLWMRCRSWACGTAPSASCGPPQCC